MADGVAHVLVGDAHFARQARHEVAPAHEVLERHSAGCDGGDGDFRLFGAFVADEHLEFVAHMADDVGVEFVARDAHVARIHEAAERDDADVRRATADIDYHVAARLVDGQLDTDSRSHRFFDDVDFARARRPGGVAHCAHFHGCNSRRDTDDDTRPQKFRVSRLRLPYQVREHFGGHLEIGNDAVYDGLDRLDVRGSAAEHLFGLCADGHYLPRLCVHCDDARLIDDDAAALYIDERIGRTEVDADIIRKKT